MAAVTYTKNNWKAEVDIRQLPEGKFQGVVLILPQDRVVDRMPHLVETMSDTPEEALEEAKALAHRLLSAC